MTDLFPFALSLSIGLLLLAVFDPVAGIGPRWAALLFRVSLGSVLGVGFSAIVYFTLLAAGLAKPWTILTIEIACTAVLAVSWIGRRRVGADGPANPTNRSPRNLGVAWVLTGIFVCALLLVGGRLIQIAIANPTGEWDASAIWNLRAKFLTDQHNWRFALSPLIETRPEYPLLLSSFIARGWKLGGTYRAMVPMVLGLTFWTALLGLTVTVLAMIRGTTAAMLGGLILLSTAPLLFWATTQYADIPLACYFLATLALLFIDARTEAQHPWALLWAGVCAGLAAGTKDEGDVFAAIVLIAVLVQRAPWQRVRLLFAGMLAALLPTIGLKVFLPAPSQLVTGQTVAGILAKIEDPGRYSLIGKSLFDRMMELGSAPGHPLILLAILALAVSPQKDQRYRLAVWTGSAAVGGMLLSYLGVFVITPRDLPWHLFTALDRLLLQIWPCAVLLFCRVLPDDSGFALPFSNGWTIPKRGRTGSA